MNATQSLKKPIPNKVRIFGFCVASDFSFTFPMLPAAGPTELTIQVITSPPADFDFSTLQPRYRSPSPQKNHPERMRYYHHAGWEMLCFPGSADFYLSRDTILLQIASEADLARVEVNLLGTVLAFWLEMRGILALHASAVVIHGQAVGFLSSNRGGKTSLSAGLLQAGHSLLSDDILAIEYSDNGFLVRPSYPAMRMWPAEIQHFVSEPAENFALVISGITKRRVLVGNHGWGSFSSASRPPTIFYIPERRQSSELTISSHTLTPRQATLELLRQSFAPNLAHAAGLNTRRLNLIAQLAQSVPFRRLVYPNEYEQLANVCQFILRDYTKS